MVGYGYGYRTFMVGYGYGYITIITIITIITNNRITILSMVKMVICPEILPKIFPALQKNAKSHWHQLIKSLSINVLKLFNENISTLGFYANTANSLTDDDVKITERVFIPQNNLRGFEFYP